MRVNADECQRRGFIAIGKLGRVIEAVWEAPKFDKRGQASGPPLDDDGEPAAAAEDGDLDWDDPRSFIGFSRSGAQQSSVRYTLCCNAPIQGACADVIMLAMIAIERAMRDADISGGLVLSVHDELVIEVVADRADEAAALLQRCMEQAFAEVFPKAPLTGLVKLGHGRTWSEAKS
jgi:hypothetical protein